MPTPAHSIPILRVERVDSTSKLAKRRLMAEPEPARVTAHALSAAEQSAGVGRFDRPWASPSGGVWCTLVWPLPGPAAPEEATRGLGLRAGVACTRAVRRICRGAGAPDEPVRLKWPNDVLLNGRKVLGVLCELLHVRGSAFALVGVGLNANFDPDALPAGIAQRATTLRAELGGDIDLAAAEAELLRSLSEAVPRRGLSPAELDEATALLHGLHQPVTATMPDRSTIAGRLIGLDPDGLAVLQTAAGPFVMPPGSVLMPA